MSVSDASRDRSKLNSRWLYIGPSSSIPDIASLPSTTGSSTDHKFKLISSCKTDQPSSVASTNTLQDQVPACKIFQIPTVNGTTQEHEPEHDNTAALNEVSPDAAPDTAGLEHQLLIFRHRGKLHAIDHRCPHQSYPLSQGSVYDIEDFGIVLSAGIQCPKHGWAFDLFTGESDRGAYRLTVWDVKVDEEEQVWVKRRP